jgi:hypothetical protein
LGGAGRHDTTNVIPSGAALLSRCGGAFAPPCDAARPARLQELVGGTQEKAQEHAAEAIPGREASPDGIGPPP